MESTSLPQIFISYAQEDAAMADLIVKALEGLAFTLWIDRAKIKPGDSFVEKMNQGLSKASYVVVLVSRASLASRWVSREWMSTLAAAETVLLPVLIEDCELPAILRDVLYVDLRTDKDAGLARLRLFFEKEHTPVTTTRETVRAKSAGVTLRTVSRRHLRLVALRCMTEKELQGFLFDADMEAGILQGYSLHERITNLLVHADHDGDLEKFADWLALEPSCIRCISRELRRLGQEESWTPR